jgi:organic radical activating enzyme
MSNIITTDKEHPSYKYSEIFYSFQGEGRWTGMPTAWIRFFLCNLQCDGFGQKDPTDPSTYVLPYKDFDVSTVKQIEDLPVWEYGCDSSYTWAKQYRHLAHNEPAKVICENICAEIAHPSNPNGLFQHPLTQQETHMAFTGGEPMLNQDAIVDIMTCFYEWCNVPRFVTVETNGTKPLKDPLFDLITSFYTSDEFGGLVDDERGAPEWFWSCSPKLWSTAGEKPKKAIKPEYLARYNEVSPHGQLKYVVNGTQQSWDEVEEHTQAFRDVGIEWPVYIMPVGATMEEQSEDVIPEIAVEAMKRGYYFSGRLHCYVFGNQIGT